MHRIRSMDYKSAGVDVEAGRAFVQRIKASVEATHRPEVIGGLGGFGGLMRLPAGLRKPFWSQAPMASEPNWSWPRSMAAITAWASTWWRCASTT